jgi:hypothetical protein
VLCVSAVEEDAVGSTVGQLDGRQLFYFRHYERYAVTHCSRAPFSLDELPLKPLSR